MYVAREGAQDVQFALRVRDLSRQSESWGAEVPVVRERDYRTSTFDLVDVPLLSSFRPTIRVYDVDPDRGAAQVRIRIYGTTHRTMPFEPFPNAAPPDKLVFETTRDFSYTAIGTGVLNYPGYFELADIRSLAPGFATARIEIEPLTQGHRYWAMASITNNDTQQVTLVTPH